MSTSHTSMQHSISSTSLFCYVNVGDVNHFFWVGGSVQANTHKHTHKHTHQDTHKHTHTHTHTQNTYIKIHKTHTHTHTHTHTYLDGSGVLHAVLATAAIAASALHPTPFLSCSLALFLSLAHSLTPSFFILSPCGTSML